MNINQKAGVNKTVALRPRLVSYRSSIRRFTRMESGDYMQENAENIQEQILNKNNNNGLDHTFSGTLYDEKVLDRVLIQHSSCFLTETVILEPSHKSWIFFRCSIESWKLLRLKLLFIFALLLVAILNVQMVRFSGPEFSAELIGFVCVVGAALYVFMVFIHRFSYFTCGALERCHTIAWTIEKFSKQIKTRVISPVFQTDTILSGIEWYLTVEEDVTSSTKFGLIAAHIPFDLIDLTLEVKFKVSDSVTSYIWDPVRVKISEENMSINTYGKLKDSDHILKLLRGSARNDHLVVECHIAKVRYFAKNLKGLMCSTKFWKDTSFSRRVRDGLIGEVSYPVIKSLNLELEHTIGSMNFMDNLATLKSFASFAWTIPDFDILLQQPKLANLISPRICVRTDGCDRFCYLHVCEDERSTILLKLYLIEGKVSKLPANIEILFNVEVKDWNNNLMKKGDVFESFKSKVEQYY